MISDELPVAQRSEPSAHNGPVAGSNPAGHIVAFFSRSRYKVRAARRLQRLIGPDRREEEFALADVLVGASVPAIKTTIYALIDPRYGALRYVGKTVRSLQWRFRGHLNEARSGGKSHKNFWLRQLYNAGFQPDIVEIEIVHGDAWIEAERFWIGYFRMIGCDLVNHTTGGESAPGWNLSEDAKRRISEGNKGKSKSPEHIAKILAGPGVFKKGQPSRNAGKKLTAETRAKISAVQKGIPKGPQAAQHRANHLKAMKTRKRLGTWTDAQRIAHANRKWTEEARAKHEAAMSARKELGAQRSDAGIPWSEERKQQFNEKLRARRATGWHPRWNPNGGKNDASLP